jgi:DNA-binding transcriptional LysR family regulator
MGSRLLSHVKMRHFSLIAAIADHGSMHRASDALNMTQSTMSKMLGDLEALLGAQLFHRGPHGMVPTPLGAYALNIA